MYETKKKKKKKYKRFRPTFNLSMSCIEDEDPIVFLINGDKKKISRIEKNIFVSGTNAINIENLKRFGITKLLNCATKEEEEFVKKKLLGYSYEIKTLNIKDHGDSDFAGCIDEAIKYIKANVKYGILIFCQAGISRSPSIAMAYYISCHHLSFDEAFQKLIGARTCTDPNISFLVYLKKM